MKRVTICKVPVDAVSRAEALERCREFLYDGKQHRVATINPEFIVEAQNNSEFRKTLQKSDLALADGIGVSFAARHLHGLGIERIPGVDFLFDLCELAAKEHATVFFLGGRGGVARRTAELLRERIPNLQVGGWNEEVEKITNIDADILFVALGSPKQELWIVQNLAKLPRVKIAMGVGGAFDIISGKIKRAPLILRTLGLEWLWRFIKEPWRLGRICKAVFLFSSLILKEKSRGMNSSAG
ncbi:MAG: WecB/TagA/CpsF family glycosyltransferase [bacterium]|nr:WecB/TagA/CpsF family glycosyltransferase [bacterium]